MVYETYLKELDYQADEEEFVDQKRLRQVLTTVDRLLTDEADLEEVLLNVHCHEKIDSHMLDDHINMF